MTTLSRLETQARRLSLWKWLVALAVWFNPAEGLHGPPAAAAEAPPVIEPMTQQKFRPAVISAEKEHSPVLEPTPWCAEPNHLVPDRIGLLLHAAVTEDERLLVETALYTCSRKPKKVADVWWMLMVLRTEVDVGIPEEARGILLASWCIEGGLRLASPDGGPLRGDYRNGVAHAFGPFQLWPWHRQWCGITDAGADDPVTAARCYANRIMDRREVRALSCKESWRVGEALAANGPRYLHQGCAAESSHWRELLRWRAVMQTQKREAQSLRFPFLGYRTDLNQLAQP